jgi:hypothetical protein
MGLTKNSIFTHFVQETPFMKRFGSISLAAVAVVFLLLLTERKAFGFSGYVDPGTGLLTLQCATSVVVAAGYYLRRRIRALFSSKSKKDKAPLVGAVSPRPTTPNNPA